MTGSDPRQRIVQVAPERLAGWIDRFRRRHGALTVTLVPDGLSLSAPDGAVAVASSLWGPPADTDDVLADFVADALRPRRLAVLLVRKSAHAVGIVEGDRLIVGKVGRHYVQGRTKAGGWSQQRYARRRDHQAEQAFASAADDAVELLLPRIGELEGLVCGGDGAAAHTVLLDPRLARLAALPRFGRSVISVPDPRRAVLAAFPTIARAVPIRLNAQAQAERDESAPGQDDSAGSQ